MSRVGPDSRISSMVIFCLGKSCAKPSLNKIAPECQSLGWRPFSKTLASIASYYHENLRIRIKTTADIFRVNMGAETGDEGFGDPKIRGRQMKILVKFCKDESGATAIEYGLIAAGIAIAIIAAVKGVGSQLSTNFNTISNSLK